MECVSLKSKALSEHFYSHCLNYNIFLRSYYVADIVYCPLIYVLYSRILISNWKLFASEASDLPGQVVPFFDTKGGIYVTKYNTDPIDVCMCSSYHHLASCCSQKTGIFMPHSFYPKSDFTSWVTPAFPLLKEHFLFIILLCMLLFNALRGYL